MTIGEMNAGIDFLIEKIKNILGSLGPVGSKQLLIHLLSDPDVSKYRKGVGDKELKEILKITAYRLLRLNLIHAELSFDLEDIDSKTVYCLPE